VAEGQQERTSIKGIKIQTNKRVEKIGNFEGSLKFDPEFTNNCVFAIAGCGLGQDLASLIIYYKDYRELAKQD